MLKWIEAFYIEAVCVEKQIKQRKHKIQIEKEMRRTFTVTARSFEPVQRTARFNSVYFQFREPNALYTCIHVIPLNEHGAESALNS